MAERKTTAEKTVDNVEIVDKKIDLDARVTVKNLGDWKVYFTRKHDGIGDVVIAENGEQRLSRNEIQAQVNGGNKLFTGTDGFGSHATVYIKDAATRKYLGFETSNKPQMVFSDKLAKELFAMSQEDFEKKLPNYIVTRAEKYALNEAIDRLGLNDYRKIMYAKEYTGYPKF